MRERLIRDDEQTRPAQIDLLVMTIEEMDVFLGRMRDKRQDFRRRIDRLSDQLRKMDGDIEDLERLYRHKISHRDGLHDAE